MRVIDGLAYLLLISRCANSASRHDTAYVLSRVWLDVAKNQELYDGPITFSSYGSESDNQEQTGRSPSHTRALTAVQTTSGLVVGATEDEVQAFYGIPYAQPPVGELRFQPPVVLQSSEVVNASVNNRLKCVQAENACLFPNLPGRKESCSNINMKEDCLVLNVYVPVYVNLTDAASPPGNQLAVMFYIHGGSFNGGSGYGVDGRGLASFANVILVTVNYRLGPFGFLVNKEAGKPDINGNQGLKDQQLALQWVEENIENFGGDKSRVTIFGGSAGAQSVMFHTLSENSAPFYWNAILQSAPVFIEFHTPSESQDVTDWLVRGLCGKDASAYDCLMNADPIELSNRLIPMIARGFLNRDIYTMSEAFRPVIDGVEFTAQPLDLYAGGRWNSDKNTIVGVQSQELEDVEYYIPEPVPTGEIMFSLVNYFLFSTGTTDEVVKKYSASYPPVDDNYVKTFGKELTHLYFVCPSRALARLAAETISDDAKVYFYVNSYPVADGTCLSQSGDDTEGCYMATHDDETRFVMRTVNNPSESDLQIQNQFSTYWGNFARTGNPNYQPQTSLGNLTEWPVYTSSVDSSRWKSIHLKAPMSEAEAYYEEDICNFWDSLGVYMDAIPLPSSTPATRETTKPISNTPFADTTSTDEAETQRAGIFSTLIAVIVSTIHMRD